MRVIQTASRFRSFVLLGTTLLVLTAAFIVSGCDNTKTETVFVEVEKPLFVEPPAAALGFLGYDEAAEKLTVCGNCHVGQQSAWQFTAHAEAWAGLQSSPGAQAFCENCHTDGPLGNPTDDGGWAATQDERYHDVQCESCHGPGQQHVENPDASQPIASLAVGDLSDLANATGCAECHQGTHHPFAEEWAQSKHSGVVGFAAAREDCAGCHSGQGALKAWGVKDEYVEKDSPDHMAITCGVCHDPHDATYEGQLRFPVATTSIEEHLCARCHDRRTVPDPNSSHGLEPHAPETALLLGEAGWFPPNVTINQGQIVASHGSVANRKLCATCHVSMFEITDPASGDHVFNATGHLFYPIPCVDEQGIPMTETDCSLTADARAFNGCTSAGCHGSQEAAASALTVATTRIQDRADELLAALEQVDPGLDEAGGEIDAADPTFTVAEGAFFNYHLATFAGKTTGASAHNPFLVEALLIASLQAVTETYGVSVNASVNWEEELQVVLDKVPQDITPIRRFSSSPERQPTLSRAQPMSR